MGTNRKNFNRAVVAVVAALLMTGAWRAYSSHPKSNAIQETARVQGILERNTPIGSSRASVQSYLTSQSIAYSTSSEVGGKVMNALIRGESASGLIETDFQVSFRFNESDQLIGYSLKEVFTGP